MYVCGNTVLETHWYTDMKTIPLDAYENIIEPRSDNRDLLAIKFKSEIFTEKERPSCCEQLQKI